MKKEQKDLLLQLGALWEKMPNLRFCQLVATLVENESNYEAHCIFYIADAILQAHITKCLATDESDIDTRE